MEHDAFEEAARECKDRIYSFAAMMLRDPEEARDVSQEALVRLWRHRSKVEPAGAKTWLMRTTHNLCIDRIRRRKVRGEVDGEEVIPFQADEGPGPNQLAESSELGGKIGEALRSLSGIDRAVVLMREVQGMAYEEIARALDMPMGTLKARLHRARERLRNKLADAGVTP